MTRIFTIVLLLAVCTGFAQVFEEPKDLIHELRRIHTPNGTESLEQINLNAPKKQISAVTKFVIPCTEAFQTLYGHLGQWGFGGDEVISEGKFGRGRNVKPCHP